MFCQVVEKRIHFGFKNEGTDVQDDLPMYRLALDSSKIAYSIRYVPPGAVGMEGMDNVYIITMQLDELWQLQASLEGLDDAMDRAKMRLMGIQEDHPQ